jgi:4-amino-4-deoxy-L-arabinose transferase-like glycosyltransferase
MSQPSPASVTQTQTAWWLEPQLFFVLLLAATTYCLRISDVQLFGEEPRRALIAREMVESGDWLIPGTQRVFLPSRPPLQNWLIAIAGISFGSIDIWAARLPSMILTIATAVIIYGYLRQTIESLGSAAGAVSYLTMQLVMEFGRSAETEAVFTSFVGASMLFWHWGWIRQWPAWKMWSIGYGFAALGMLTKGLQAPVYFAGSAGLFLLITGNWRAIVTVGHVTGILVFVVIFGAWQGLFTWQRGIKDSWNIYFSDVAERFVDKSWWTFISHLISYPAELLFVRTMPWSVLLLTYGSGNIRKNLGRRRESVIFLTIGILFSFVFVWLPPGSKVRYYMPLFPNFAALFGIAMDCLVMERNETGRLILWTNIVRIATYVMAGTAIFVLAVSLIAPSLLISLSGPGAFGFAFAALALACLAHRSIKQSDDFSISCGMYCIGFFCALVQLSLITTVLQRRCEEIAGNVDAVRQQIPADATLVSLGQVHHAFAYFYRRPIPIVDPTATRLPEGVEYFCVHRIVPGPPTIPFEWTQIAEVAVDRFKVQPVPKERVYVGRIEANPKRIDDVTRDDAH